MIQTWGQPDLAVFRVDNSRLATVIAIGVDGDRFDPSLSFSRFGGRASASFRFLYDHPGDVSTDGAKVFWRAEGVEARLYPIDDVETQDGYEFELWLSRRPDGPLTFSVTTAGINGWDYQPPLAHANVDGSTWEINPWGGLRYRPAYVVGSYVAYGHDEGDYTAIGGYNFRSGKILHIYRPWAEGANGHREWCDLRIIDGLMTITIPSSLLDDPTAYPLYVDPTFGYSGTAASDDNLANSHILVKAASTPTDGSLTSVTIKGRNKLGTTADHRPAIFSDVVGVPTTNLAAVDTAGSVYGASDAEVTTNISFASLVNGTQYWLGSRSNLGDGIGVDNFFKFDVSGGTANMFFKSPTTGTSWEANGVGYSSADNEKVYIFGTYTGTATDLSALIGEPITGSSQIEGGLR